MKNKWLAGMLNIIPGLGYLYLGTRIPFAFILLLMWPALVIAGSFDPALAASPSGNTGLSWGILLVLAIPALAFMVDAYNEAIQASRTAIPAEPIKESRQPVKPKDQPAPTQESILSRISLYLIISAVLGLIATADDDAYDDLASEPKRDRRRGQSGDEPPSSRPTT